MRHGSLRWYSSGLRTNHVRALTALGLMLVHPVREAAVELTMDGDRLVSEDELLEHVDSQDEVTFQMWLDPSTDIVISRPLPSGQGAVTFALDGLTLDEQRRVCSMVLRVAVDDGSTRVLVGAAYLDDMADLWDDFAAHGGDLPIGGGVEVLLVRPLDWTRTAPSDGMAP